MKRISLQIILPMVGVAVVASLAVYGITSSHTSLTAPASVMVVCSQKKVNHIITIQEGKTSPAHTEGRLCDTLTIKNLDNITRFIAFGQHDHHQSYDGTTKKTLEQNQNFTITMDQTGKFMFHDHANDEVEGTFTVQ